MKEVKWNLDFSDKQASSVVMPAGTALRGWVEVEISEFEVWGWLE